MVLESINTATPTLHWYRTATHHRRELHNFPQEARSRCRLHWIPKMLKKKQCKHKLACSIPKNRTTFGCRSSGTMRISFSAACFSAREGGWTWKDRRRGYLFCPYYEYLYLCVKEKNPDTHVYLVKLSNAATEGQHSDGKSLCMHTKGLFQSDLRVKFTILRMLSCVCSIIGMYIYACFVSCCFWVLGKPQHNYEWI